MKAMKKILFLTLIFALALTATAFASSTTTNLDASEVLATIRAIVANDGIHDCGTDKKFEGTYTTEAQLAADCTLDASVNVKCPTCKDAFVGTAPRNGETGKGHVWGEKSESVKDPATCITAGTTKTVVKCENCSVVSETVTANTPAAYGHTMLTDLLNDELKVDGKGYTYDASKPMSTGFAQALENVVADWNKKYDDYSKGVDANLKDSYAFQGKNLKVDYTPADACKAGYIKVTCDHCKAVLFEQEFAGKHDWQWTANYISAFPTCDTPGEVYVQCEKCNEQLKVYLPAYGHEMSKVMYVRQNGKLVATTTDGKTFTDLKGEKFVECEVYQLVYACELGNFELESLKLYIDKYIKTVDELKDWTAANIEKLAVELVKSFQVDLKVAGCEHIEYVDGAKVKPALWDHVYDLNQINSDEFKKEFTVYGKFDGNCFEPAHFYLRCNGCEKWTEKIVGAEPSHKWEPLKDGKVTKKATCSANGEVELECTVLNCEGKKTVVTDKLAHNLYWQHTGDCERSGKLEETCRVCDTVVTTIDVDAWHDPAQRTNITLDNAELIKTINENGLVMPIYDVVDCTKDGTVKYYCKKCQSNVTETIKATGHNYNLENADLNKNGKKDDQIIRADYETVVDGKFDTVKDGIVQPTCSTYGYIYLQCTNPGCKDVQKLKNAEKLEHFSKKATASETIIPSTCTEKGTKTVVCLCGKTETTELALLPHTPTKIDGKDVCIVCGTELKLDTAHKFNIQTTEMNVTSTAVSGRGVIELDEGAPVLHKTLFARINYNFTLDNGESYAYIACVEVANDGSFRAASPACPYGATLTNVTIMITTDADAQDKVISEVTNLGVKVVK